jgi:flagellar motor switch protein FliG
MNTIELVQSFEPEKLFNKIWNEKAETIAQILLCMEYHKAPDVFSKLTLETQISVVINIAIMTEITVQELVKIDKLLTDQFSNQIHENGLARGGIDAVVELLNYTHRDIFEKIIDKLENTNPELTDEILRRMLVFEDIIIIDDNYTKNIFNEINNHELEVALKGVDEVIQDKIFHNMSVEKEKLIKKEMYEMGPMRIQDVEKAQYKIIKYIRNSKKSGK